MRINCVVSYKLARQSRGHGNRCVFVSTFQSAQVFKAVLVSCINDGLRFTAADATAGAHAKAFAECLKVITAALYRSFDIGFLDGVAKANVHGNNIINTNES